MTPAAGWRLGACIGMAGLVVASLSGACLVGCGRFRSLACNCHPQRSVSVDGRRGLQKAAAAPVDRGILVRAAASPRVPAPTGLDAQTQRGG